MRVFVLCTGRCGSNTFAAACQHITNYSAAWESGYLRDDLDFPDNHIEVNLSLVWYAGLLRQRFPNARYVHLTRNAEQTAQSTAARGDSCRTQILHAWRHAVRMGWLGPPREILTDAREYIDATTSLIDLVLRDVPSIDVQIEQPHSFEHFWRWIGAAGNLGAAVATFRTVCNWNPNRHPDW